MVLLVLVGLVLVLFGDGNVVWVVLVGYGVGGVVSVSWGWYWWCGIVGIIRVCY